LLPYLFVILCHYWHFCTLFIQSSYLPANSICFYRIYISLQNYDNYFDFREKKEKKFKIVILVMF